MKNNIPVSIIAPAFNHEKYIFECLSSVASQRHDNMELIIIDDASRDNTVEIIAKTISDRYFRNMFPLGLSFIRHEKNIGAHHTINQGLNLAKGKYLAVINTDDKYGSGHLQGLIEACEETKSEFSFGAIKPIDENGKLSKDNYVDELMNHQKIISKCPTVSMALTKGNAAISTGNMLFTSGLFKKLNGFRNYRYVHDWDFILRACLNTEPVFLPDIYYEYRLHEKNTVNELRAHPENSTDGNPLIDFLIKIISGEYINKKIPAFEVWEYFFEYKQYGLNDLASRGAWERAKEYCMKSN